MTEQDFWVDLEYRVTTALALMNDKSLRSLWCDGFIPESYLPSEIVGVAWIGRGSRHQERWQFQLVLPKAYESRVEVPWALLLPDASTTNWLNVDPVAKTIRLDSSIASAG